MQLKCEINPAQLVNSPYLNNTSLKKYNSFCINLNKYVRVPKSSFIFITQNNKVRQDYQILKIMSINCNEVIFDLRNHYPPDKLHPTDGPILNGKYQLNHDKQNFLNTCPDEEVFDQENSKKKNESKQRYRRLKQKLASLCSQHQQKCLIKNNKQVSSPNKSRLLTLAIQIQKMTLNQTKDYGAIQSKLKEIQKILDLKRQHDLYILKQSRFVPAFSALLKKVPTFHKNQFFQSVKTVQIGLKVLRVFCTLSSNRDYMISTNQLCTLNSCLSSFIGKQQKKLAIECLGVLNELICSKIKADSDQIVNITLQIVFFGQLARRLRTGIEACITQQGVTQQQYVIKSLKYLYILYRKCFEKYLQRPLYQQPDIPQIMQFHVDSLLLQLEHLLPVLLLDKQENCLKQEQLPICFINIVLYILKLINLCVHVSYCASQKTLQFSSKSPFWQTIKHLFRYSKQNLEQKNSNHELNSIYSEMVDLLGKICCENEQNRKFLTTSDLLEMLYNHPIVYIMDPKLKSLLIPSLCSVMNLCQPNMKKYLSQNSAQNIINFIMAQKKRCSQLQIKNVEDYNMKQTDKFSQDEETGQQQKLNPRILSRKESVSSLNSYTTQCTQNSYMPLTQEDRYTTGLLFIIPFENWEPLMEKLKQLDS